MLEFIILIAVAYFFLKGKIQRATTKVEFKNKLVWITGASSGIGEELSKQFAEAGATVILSSRKEAELQRVKKSLKNSDRHYILPLDMSKTAELMEKTKAFVATLEKEGKKIDIVVENAGVSQRALCIDTDYETHEYLTRLNYHGPVAHTKAFLQHMIKNKNGQIVIISSVAGKITPGMRTSYVGSKHAISGFFDSLRAEIFDHNISVTQIYPGYVQTGVSKNALTGKGTESLGKTDTNIAGGQPVDVFGKEALYNIYIKRKDVIISIETKHYIGTYIKQLFPDFVAKIVHKNLSQQLDALKKAK